MGGALARTCVVCKVIVVAITLALPLQADAAMSVIDPTAIAKLTEQLNQMREQAQKLTDLAKKGQAAIDAVGKMGKINLPIMNMARLIRDIEQDAKCLAPDFSDLMPGIELEEMRIGNICHGAAFYRNTLWSDPKNLRNKTIDQRRKIADEVQKRRDRVYVDAATKGLGQGDVAAKNVEELNKAATELEEAVNASTNSNDRLTAIGKGQVLMVRAMAQQNQILAQMLKLQSAIAMEKFSKNLLADEDEEQ